MISIHSLAWRKTLVDITKVVHKSNFNPLSRMEKDLIAFVYIFFVWNFNPLSRMEKDFHSKYRCF